MPAANPYNPIPAAYVPGAAYPQPGAYPSPLQPAPADQLYNIYPRYY